MKPFTFLIFMLLSLGTFSQNCMPKECIEIESQGQVQYQLFDHYAEPLASGQIPDLANFCLEANEYVLRLSGSGYVIVSQEYEGLLYAGPITGSGTIIEFSIDCPAPQCVEFVELTDTKLLLKWQGAGYENSYRVHWRLAGRPDLPWNVRNSNDKKNHCFRFASRQDLYLQNSCSLFTVRALFTWLLL